MSRRSRFRVRDAALPVAIVAGSAVIGALVVKLGLWMLPVTAVAIFATLAFYRLDWGILALIFVLPFMAIEGAHVTLIQEFKRLLVVGVGLAWIVHVLLGRRPIRGSPWITALLAVLGLAAVLSLFRAPAPDVALSSTARLVAYGFVYVVVLVDVLRRPNLLWRAVAVLLISATLTAAFGLYQFVAHFVGWPSFLDPFYRTEYALPRIHSVMNEPLWFANYLLVALPIAFALACWRSPTWPRFALLAAATASLGVIVAASRLGWATFGLLGILFPLLAVRHLRPGRLAGAAGALVLVLSVAAGVWARDFGSTDELTSYLADFATFASQEHGEGDLVWHLRLFGLLPDAVRTTPIVGIGTNNIGFRFHADMPNAGPQISTTHSTYLDLFIEVGGLGLLAFVGLLAGGFIVAWRGYRRYGASVEGALFFGIAMGIAAMAFHLVNWSGWREAHIWLIIGLAIACDRAFAARDADAPNRNMIVDTREEGYGAYVGLVPR